MGVGYKAVTWTPYKKRYDWIMLLLILVYSAAFVGFTVAFHPNVTPETMIIRLTGTLAFLMLHVILAIGPLARLKPQFLPLLYNRRHLGVTMFLIALIHGIFNLIQFHALGDVDALTSLFTSNGHYDSFSRFPFQVLGFIALLILAILAGTSHDYWLRNLGPKLWKALHMSVYLAYALIFFHVLLGTLQFETAAIYRILLFTGFATLAVLHILAGWRGRVAPSEGSTDAFVPVCPLEDIPADRAKIVHVNDEQIAIFKYDGKVSAVSNLCKHQHGPLGEGKIVDGCITCPWHGYQYYPHNGQSPPPFDEKITTYHVKVEKGQVWVDPKPEAPGTSIQPISISE